MSNRIHALAQQLTGKSSVEECSTEEVRQIVQHYPYFAPAQFLLLQKLKERHSPDLELQQGKAVLYFSDPLLFDYFISSENFYKHPFIEDKTECEPLIDEAYGTIASDKNGIITEEMVITGDPIEEVAFIDEPVNEVKGAKPDVVSYNTGLFDQNSSEESSKDVFSDNTDGLSINNDTAESVIPEINAVDKPRIEGEKQISSNDIEQPVPLTQPPEELAFEPFHTVDYFASQGIKISQDGLGNDRLGKQLKSFTDWLKTMKRLPAVQITGQVEMIAEKKIENMASRSVSESSVITEAMAEVWARQGNKEKAEETYNKLSLLNPSKKAFFAAKIETLKTS